MDSRPAASMTEVERKKALLEARRRVAELETPKDRLAKLCWFDMCLIGVMRTAVDLGIYKLLSESKQAMNVDEISKTVGAEPRLVLRLLRMLAADNQVDEKGVHIFAANKMTDLIARPEFEGLYASSFETMPMCLSVPKFLNQRGYKDPADKDDSPWKFGMKTDKHFFDFIHSPGNEWWLRSFEQHMTAKNLVWRPWFQTNDIAEVLGTSTGEDDVLLVDMGGNLGGDIAGLQKRIQNDFPGKVKGKLVLQDLTDTINAAKKQLPPSIEATVHNFFTPQPVKGARAYFMHMILHDWPENKCVEILQNLVPAMKRGHSKLLINEVIIPDKGANWEESGLDILMMNAHSATERTEAEWKALLGSVGLEIKKIWDCDGETEKLIEVELA